MEFTIAIPSVNVPHGLLPIVSTLIMGYLFVAAINMVFGPVIDQSIRFEVCREGSIFASVGPHSRFNGTKLLISTL